MFKVEEPQEEELYDYIPPSLKWKKDVPFIKAEHSRFWIAIWDFAVNIMIKRRFFSLRVKNSENFELRDKDVACIFYAQHSCWWDGVVGYYLCHYLFGVPLSMMIEDLIKFPILSKVGAFSISKKTPRETLKTLKYCIDFLNNEKISLWLFPQGIIKPPNHRPLEFQKGLSFIAQKVKHVNLFPIAIQYVFLRQGLPEVLIDVGKPIVVNGEVDKDNFTEYLENNFTELLDNQLHNISEGNIQDYKIMFKKRAGFWKSLERFLKARI